MIPKDFDAKIWQVDHHAPVTFMQAMKSLTVYVTPIERQKAIDEYQNGKDHFVFTYGFKRCDLTKQLQGQPQNDAA
jgi:hypothetical protein